jgi:hypothetical protein
MTLGPADLGVRKMARQFGIGHLVVQCLGAAGLLLGC